MNRKNSRSRGRKRGGSLRQYTLKQKGGYNWRRKTKKRRKKRKKIARRKK